MEAKPKTPERQLLFRQIPGVDQILDHPELSEWLVRVPREVCADVIRQVLAAVRAQILQDTESVLVKEGQVNRKAILGEVTRALHTLASPSLRAVVNGTGIVLHTNFGRAPLSGKALDAVSRVSASYNNLEYDLERRTRGSRHTHVEEALKALLKVESVLVVNNCAAAVLLTLAGLSHGKETIVSRGELVEIGGSFRIPEVMESAGAVLREVGTTNRTHLRDYESAITERTGLLMKAYRSNFDIVGFTTEVALEDLVALGAERGIPTAMDLGCGLLVDLQPYGIHRGTTVQSIVESGVDVVCFSGDKLLGGPQCGILVGKEKWISRLKSHPMTRALRVDKMVLSALEATLSSYLDGSWRTALPAHRMMTMTSEDTAIRAGQLQELLSPLEARFPVRLSIVETEGKVGGGTLPLTVLPGFGVCVAIEGTSSDAVEQFFRNHSSPIVGRVTESGFVLDVRTLFDGDFATIHACLTALLNPS